MKENKLLQLWNYPFYQLQLQTIDVKKKVDFKQYCTNYQIVGLFKIKTPQYIIKQYKKFQKSQVIKYLNDFYIDKSFVKKYKKTVSTKFQNETVKFFYIFNLSPDALVDYQIDGNEMIIQFNGAMVYKK